MAGIADFLTQRNAKFEGVDGLQPVTAATRRTLETYQKFSDESHRAKSDPNLSSLGQKTQVMEFVKKNAPEVVRATKAAERAKGRLAERRAKLRNQLPAIDKTDAAGAMIRAEIRNRLFQMEKGERKVFLAGDIDPVTAQAILEAPASLTGVSNDQRDAIVNSAVSQASPGALQRLARDADAVQVLEHAARALSEHVADLVELPASALPDFLNSVVPDQRYIDSDVERVTEILAS